MTKSIICLCLVSILFAAYEDKPIIQNNIKVVNDSNVKILVNSIHTVKSMEIFAVPNSMGTVYPIGSKGQSHDSNLNSNDSKDNMTQSSESSKDIIEETPQDQLVAYLISKKFYKSGTFTKYDFNGVSNAFDWVFITPNKDVYQLQGNKPTENNIFGWKKVGSHGFIGNKPVEITNNSWNMIFLGDYNHDGDTKFDWVLYKNIDGTDQIYKLDGVSDTGNFKYKKINGLKVSINGPSVKFIMK